MSGGGIVLILGSAPDALRCRDWPRAPFDRIVAINNAWRLRPDWDDLVMPEDFPAERRPAAPGPGQRLIEAPDFVPAQNLFGGFVLAGGTMAYTAAYWALAALAPRVLAFLGCDMVYDTSGPSHFYGQGTPDPLRADISLRDLGAKSARLALIAAGRGCACVNLSEGARSALLFPRATPATLDRAAGRARLDDPDRLAALRAREASLGYDTPDGRYWETPERFDAAALDALDGAWRDFYAREASGGNSEGG